MVKALNLALALKR